jgi:hypothetical protein
MPLFAAFVGGSNTERSLAIASERSVNLFRSTVESEGSPKRAYLIGTPGQKRLGLTGAGVCRGVFTQDGRLWTVVGSVLYELTSPPFQATARGTIVDDGQPVSWASNGDGGNQLAIVGGGQLRILNLLTNDLSDPVNLPLTRAPSMVGYLDGYFLLSEIDSPIVWFSNLENGLLFDALDFFARSTASDYVVAMICANNRVWVFGSETSEAYEDVGDADNPFQPIKGSLFQIGCAGKWTVSVGVNTMRWVGVSSRSGPTVYRLDGYNGTRISTHAIEAQLAKATTLADAEALTYEQDGHLFYALTCPSLGVAGETHVIDESEQGQWHQRAAWNTALGREEAWGVRGHAYVGVLHVVGSRTSGAICVLDLETYDDDGAILRAVRRAPYAGAENAWAFVSAFELGVEPGAGLNLGQGQGPTIELRVSKDSAKTWFSMGPAPLGPMGSYDDRTYWTRIGRARIDRLVFETIITDPVKRVLGPGAWLQIRPGAA